MSSDTRIQFKSEKQRLRYMNIEWLMPSIDVVQSLERLGVEVDRIDGDEVYGLCPDHHLFVGRQPSHPKWSVNMVTGVTNCFTEHRGSNLVFIVCRLLGKDPDEAALWLTGKDVEGDLLAIRLSGLRKKCSKALSFEEREKKRMEDRAKRVEVNKVLLNSIGGDLKNPHMSKKGYEYFIHPPGKKPTNIKKETVDYWKCFSRDYGYYKDRVIIPIFMRQELVGFTAMDILGKEEWLRSHPTKSPKQYRKVLHSSGYRSAECLFGFDEVPYQPEYLVITEAPREVMKLWQEGFSAVSLQKASLSPEQHCLLAEKNAKYIVLMFDGDDVGYEKTREQAKKLSVNFSVKPIFIPRGYDPKNLFRNDFLKLIEKAKTASI